MFKERHDLSDCEVLWLPTSYTGARRKPEYKRLGLLPWDGCNPLAHAATRLSSVNKRPGHAARIDRRKRQALLASTTHLLEIDLLRAGERPSLAEPLPEAYPQPG